MAPKAAAVNPRLPRQSRKNSDEARAWVVDDNGRSRADAAASLRSIGVRSIPIATRAEFLARLAQAGDTESVPDLVVLDLRLPWEPEDELVDNPLVGGIRCLRELQSEHATARVPVVVFSAFVEDELVRAELRPYEPAAIVDKIDPTRLAVVADNVLPSRKPRVRDHARSFGQKSERQLLRIAGLIGAFTAIAGFLALVINWLV
jgi:CheY-like chemotaxis protein